MTWLRILDSSLQPRVRVALLVVAPVGARLRQIHVCRVHLLEPVQLVFVAFAIVRAALLGAVHPVHRRLRVPPRQGPVINARHVIKGLGLSGFRV
jgi:hypothetical protein